MVGALGVVQRHSPTQLFLGFCVSSTYMCIVLRHGPYLDDALDLISFSCSLTLCMTIFLALLKSVDQHRAQRQNNSEPWEIHDDTLSVAMIGLNVVPFIVAMVSFVKKILESRKSERKRFTIPVKVKPLELTLPSHMKMSSTTKVEQQN